MYVCSLLASNLASLYAGAFFQFTIGLIGAPSLYTLQGLLWLGPWDLGWRISFCHFCV